MFVISNARTEYLFKNILIKLKFRNKCFNFIIFLNIPLKVSKALRITSIFIKFSKTLKMVENINLFFGGDQRVKLT